MRRGLLAGILTVSLSLLGVACSGDDDDTPDTTTVTEPSTEVTAEPTTSSVPGPTTETTAEPETTVPEVTTVPETTTETAPPDTSAPTTPRTE